MLWPANSEATAAKKTSPSQVKGLADGGRALALAFARTVRPRPRRTVAAWAEARRQVSADSGSPWPGAWRNDNAPCLVEVQEVLSLWHPAREVVLVKAHQVGGTETAINLVLSCIDEDPCSILYVLPSLDEGKAFVKLKFNPSVEASPRDLRRKIKEQKSRDEDGSTTALKKFPGGFLRITGANSSKGLKMISARVLVLDEVTEYPDDVDGQGDPVALAEKRTTAFSRLGYKRLYLSTPGSKGTCRVTRKYEASDQRRPYVPCPHCGSYQLLEWRNLRWEKEGPPQAWFPCQDPECGGVIEHRHKPAMLAGAAWIRTYPGDDQPPKWFRPDELDRHRSRPGGGRQPGFHLWQAYSLAVDWDDTVLAWRDAEGNPAKEKDFVRQVLAEAFEETGESPDHERLKARLQEFRKGRVLPAGALVLTGMADVQGNRLEWGVWSWGIGLSRWLVDWGVIEGDPRDDAVWRELDRVMAQTYEGAAGRQWPVDAWGVDTGFLSHRVYLFCRGRPRVFALDGRAGALHPLIGTPSKKDISWQGKPQGAVMLWPTGTHPAKSDVYASLHKTIAGPNDHGVWPLGTTFLPLDVDEPYLKQLTAEYLRLGQSKGRDVYEWVKPKDQPNEALDIAVGARCLAYHLGLDNLTVDRWKALAAERGAPPEQAQRDLAELWSAASAAEAARHREPTPAAQRRVVASSYLRR